MSRLKGAWLSSLLRAPRWLYRPGGYGGPSSKTAKVGIVVVTTAMFVWVVCLILSSGPYGTWLASPSSFGRVAKQRLTVEEALADVAALAELIRGAYAGFERVGGRSCDWDKIFDAMKSAVADNRQQISVIEWMELAAGELGCTGDGHIQFIAKHARGQNRDVRPPVPRDQLYLARNRNQGAEGDTREPTGVIRFRCGEEITIASTWPVLTGDSGATIEWQIGVLLPGEGQAEITCEVLGGRNAKVRETKKLVRPSVSDGVVQRPWRIEIVTGRVAEIGVPSCTSATSFGWQRLYDATDEIRRSQVILLDLRGNGGGWDLPMLDWFARLTKGDFAYIDNTAIESNVALQGRANRLNQLVGAGRNVGITWRPRLKETVSNLLTLQAKRLQNIGQPFRKRTIENLRWTGEAKTPYQGRIVVFVDNGCASACECAVAAAVAMPGTIVIGENTRGLMASGKILPFVLPNSGVTVKIPNYYGGPSGSPVYFEERKGFLPDLVVDSNRPYDVAKSLAQCLLSSECAKAVDAAVEQKRRQVRESGVLN